MFGDEVGLLAQAVARAFDLMMAGGWRFSIAAKVQGEEGTVESRPAIVENAILLIDAADFWSGEGNPLDFDVSIEATIHRETVPAPIVSAVGVAATPTTSLFQQDLIAIRRDPRPRPIDVEFAQEARSARQKGLERCPARDVWLLLREHGVDGAIHAAQRRRKHTMTV